MIVIKRDINYLISLLIRIISIQLLRTLCINSSS